MNFKKTLIIFGATSGIIGLGVWMFQPASTPQTKIPFTPNEVAATAFGAAAQLARIPASQFTATAPSKDPIKGGTVVREGEVPSDIEGQRRYVKIFQTNYKYPLLKEEKYTDQKTGKEVAVRQMVADHVVVQLKSGRERSELESIVQNAGGTIRREFQYSGIYLVSFNPDSSLLALENFQKKIASFSDVVQTSGKDYLTKLDPTQTQQTAAFQSK